MPIHSLFPPKSRQRLKSMQEHAQFGWHSFHNNSSNNNSNDNNNDNNNNNHNNNNNNNNNNNDNTNNNALQLMMSWVRAGQALSLQLPVQLSHWCTGTASIDREVRF